MKDIARQIGHVISEHNDIHSTHRDRHRDGSSNTAGGENTRGGSAGATLAASLGGERLSASMIAQITQRQQMEQQVFGQVKLHEAWDVLEAMKKLIVDDKRGNKIRSILEQHPQLINAIYEIQV